MNSSFDFDYLRALVRQLSAVVLSSDKNYLAELHVQWIAEKAGFTSIAALVESLKVQPLSDLHFQVVEALVTNETSFFRDRYPFDALQTVILPELIQRRQSTRSIVIWSAACSTGQEPYSIAMLIRQHFPQLLNWNLRVIATDFSRKALARAMQGRYTGLEVSRGLPPELRDRYFREQQNAWQISDEIRQMVEFHPLNLVASWTPPLPAIDIIFLRNVLIYFDVETKKLILARIQNQLRSDGYLFLGNGETTLNLDDAFERVLLEKSVCHRLRSSIACA